jgi:hypothetical protein
MSKNNQKNASHFHRKPLHFFSARQVARLPLFAKHIKINGLANTKCTGNVAIEVQDTFA